MELITRRLQFTEGDCFPLFFWGDWHLFNAGCAKKELYRDRETIRSTPNALYVHMGDGADFITKDDFRHRAASIDWEIMDPRRQDEYRDVAVDFLTEFERPVADKCCVRLNSNHPGKFDRLHHTATTKCICANLGQRELYAQASAGLRLIFADKHKHSCEVVMQLHHGRSTAKFKSTILKNILVKLRYWPEVDIMARGHCHFLGFDHEMRQGFDRGFTKTVEGRVIAVVSGGYLKTFSGNGNESYAEDADYDPIDIGMARINIYPSRYGARLECVL